MLARRVLPLVTQLRFEHPAIVATLCANISSQVCILRFATSSTVTCFPFSFKCFSIRSASCVVFGISQGCSSYRVLVVSSKTLFFASRYLTSRPHFVAMRPMFSFFEPVMRSTRFLKPELFLWDEPTIIKKTSPGRVLKNSVAVGRRAYPSRLKPLVMTKNKRLATAQLKLRPFKAASHSSRRLHTSTPLACAMPPAVCKRLHCCLHLRGRGRTIQNRHVVLREQAW